MANFSAIERSVDGGRIRQFTADELFALSRGFGLPIGFFLTPPVDDPRRVRIATPDSKKQGGVDAMDLLDAVLGTDESLEVWEGVLAIVGYAAGSRAVFVDGKWVDKGPVVPDQLPRARRLAALRTCPQLVAAASCSRWTSTTLAPETVDSITLIALATASANSAASRSNSAV